MPIIRFGFMLLLFCCFLFSCSRDEQSTNHIFRMNVVAGLESLDPAFAKDLNAMWADHMMYNTLIETDEHLQLKPSLAKSWSVSDDGLIYTFILRNDVFFHDNELFPNGRGRKMTAADAVYSFNRLIDPQTASTGAWIFNDRIADKEPFIALNDTVFQLRLKSPFRPLPEILTMPYCSIIPHEVAEHWGKDFRNHPCGTGPFQFHRWDENNMLILHQNKHYWEKDEQGHQLPYLDAVTISFIDNKGTEFMLFLQKKLDFVSSIDGSFKDLVLTKTGTLKKEFENKFRIEKDVFLNTEYLGFLTDTTNPLLKHSPIKYKLVRQAVNYAIDREKIVTYFKNGIGIAATGGFTPPGMKGFEAAADYGFHYDPVKAAELLKQAGFPNGKGLETITVYTPENFADICNFVASQVNEIGIPMRVEIMQPQLLKQQMSRSEVAFFRAQWIADYPDAETYLAFFNSRFPAPPNYTRYANKQFDAWYDASLNAPDSLRLMLYRKMDSLAISEAPLVPLYYDQQFHFLQNNIEGFSYNPMKLIELKRVRKG